MAVSPKTEADRTGDAEDAITRARLNVQHLGTMRCTVAGSQGRTAGIRCRYKAEMALLQKQLDSMHTNASRASG